MSLSRRDDENFQVVAHPQNFDKKSGNFLERLIFNGRAPILILCLFITIALGWSALHLKIGASLQEMLPTSQPFIKNYLKYGKQLHGVGDTVRIVVENKDGSIFNKKYLKDLEDISDAVYLVPGVDQPFMRSLWTRNVRWLKATAQGYTGGPVMPNDYDGSKGSIDKLKKNIQRSGILGSLVGNDFSSSIIYVPLLSHLNTQKDKPLDYIAFSKRLDQTLDKYKNTSIRIRVIGQAQMVGDLAAALYQVMGYFLIAAIIAGLLLFLYTRCIRSVATVLICSFIAVTWDLGAFHALGLVLDPFSVLVPFLVFAIGVSHGAQKMNGILQDVGRGTHKYVAARYTYRRLFRPGLTALLADATGFAVLAVIAIPVIRELALTASLGVAVLVFTNLILLPVLLSYVGVSNQAAKRSLAKSHGLKGRRSLAEACLDGLNKFTTRKWATSAVIVAAFLAVGGVIIGSQLQVGNSSPGAPALWPNSRYNKDVSYLGSHYQLTNNQFVLLFKTPKDGIFTYKTQIETDRLEQKLRPISGVESTESLADLVRQYTAGQFGGNPRWYTISRDKYLLPEVLFDASKRNRKFVNVDQSISPVIVYLKDHKANTLNGVVMASQKFAAQHKSTDRRVLLAAGTAGIQAATNIAVDKANFEMLALVYGAVVLLCFITFRDWRAVVVAIVPLALTSILCEALMVILGIGVTVATLPVTALGVGIGVDYALYLLSVQLAAQRQGASLSDAYSEAVRFTGKVVLLVGFTLATGLATWMWSPIRFQASMGSLLSFMFLLNMIGALILIPALSHFILQKKEKVESSSEKECIDMV